MNERHPDGPGACGGPIPKPVPRDLPDQQAAADEDPWDAVGVPKQWTADERPETEGSGAQRSGDEIPDPETPDAEIPDAEIPDTDEAGTGRRGAPHSGSARLEHPVPDEPSA
ncbi:hypothetical protein [Streptomyces sp. NBC_00328]|uniref:hypothetical protein n=1 Tax=Streptomyces sp. NBC_00328 TaxID=2903646 RepID=UPI002E2E2041|nr:hypothetical protein [Streptomyces sp. NBC_00328]